MGEIIIKGLFIGFLTSAPMGPIGVLCVQRTLNEGRKYGLFTGMGAALSDVLFAIVAGLGMGFIVDFIETNRTMLFIIGSLILIIFGAMVSRSNPAKKLQKQNKKTRSVWKDFISSFFLNLSNIGILFFYIALFTQFQFITSEYSFSVHLIGILCIGVGAVTWWVLISYVLDRLRGKVNLRALVLFNRILGILLVGIGIVALCRGCYQWLSQIIHI
jgi:threonine/homoserine/homoserine lactone efflux protein